MRPEHIPDSLEQGRGRTREHWEESEDQDDGPQASTPGSSLIHVESDEEAEENQLPLPVWLRESSKSFQWRWVPVRVRQTARAVVNWSKGPDPPQIQKITPFFPAVQMFLPHLIDKYLPKRRHKAALLAFFYFACFLTFSLVLHKSAQAGQIEGYGKPQSIWCGAAFWDKDNGCGLNGNGCRPFDGASFAFRCPANCIATHILNPHAVGRQEPNYQPFVIGGPTPSEANDTTPNTFYRADSFICQAAIHSGLIGNEGGGCGVAVLSGAQPNFSSTTRHGIESLGFDAAFPKSFTFPPNLRTTCVEDLRWPLLAVTVTFTVLLSLTTTSPQIFFPSTFTLLFLHVALVSDPPSYSTYPSLISTAAGRFLPAAFCATIIYLTSVLPQQLHLTALIERTLLWLGGAWVGSLNNYTFIHIPIQRLTPHDLRIQPGAQIALALVIILLLSIAVGQAHYLRLEARFRSYLALYLLFLACIAIAAALPWLHLRIHHYILALLLLPGTRPQTRPGLLYQGILVGLFINGIARWGFDSVLQTTGALRGDGQFGSLLPNISVNANVSAPRAQVELAGGKAQKIAFSWNQPPQPYDGLSVLVNDVERYRWYVGEGRREVVFERALVGGDVVVVADEVHGSAEQEDGRTKTKKSTVNTRRVGGNVQKSQLRMLKWEEWLAQRLELEAESVKEVGTRQYFRFGYMRGSDATDFTKAGTWEEDGGWVGMEEGAS